MDKKDFQDAARTLSSDHGISILECLHRSGWTIASDVAEVLNIHISTATKDLTNLYRSGIIERRKSKRKTRPAYEYRLKNQRIVLDLDLKPPQTSEDDISLFYLCFFEKVFQKAKKMGWSSIEKEVLREFESPDCQIEDLIIRELNSIDRSRRALDTITIFTKFLGKMRKIFTTNLGETTTKRIFNSAARDASEFNPKLCDEFHLLSELGVKNNV